MSPSPDFRKHHWLKAFVIVYNLNNSSAVLSESSELAGAERPTVILQPRLLRLAVHCKFWTDQPARDGVWVEKRDDELEQG